MASSRHGCGAFENRCWKKFYKNGGGGGVLPALHFLKSTYFFLNDLFKYSDDGT